MKETSLFCFLSMISFCGCHADNKTLKVGYVPGPFFHYGQSALSENRYFDLGIIPPDVSTIIAAVPFSNPGREPLIIEKVEGLSSGFIGWEGDSRLAPGQQGMMTLQFDKTKFEHGSATCSVRIHTNDPANSKVTLFFDFNTLMRNN